jgi:hypothetical protein
MVRRINSDYFLSSVKQLTFVTVKSSVFFEVRTEFLNILWASWFKRSKKNRAWTTYTAQRINEIQTYWLISNVKNTRRVCGRNSNRLTSAIWLPRPAELTFPFQCWNAVCDVLESDVYISIRWRKFGSAQHCDVRTKFLIPFKRCQFTSTLGAHDKHFLQYFHVYAQTLNSSW